MKKLLALVLALVMTLSLAVVGSNAAFKDADKVSATYAEAVDVLAGMKVFQGYTDGSFQPEGSITRAEVAAIVYRLYTGDVTDKQASLYATYNKFNDMNGASWAKGYIGYCGNAGLVKGYDAKTFGPSDKVTGYQALAMILRAVGYDKNNEFTGTDWQLHVAQYAQQLGILKNVKGEDLNAAASRQLVAELLFQTAAKVPCVNYTAALGYTDTSSILGTTKNNTLGFKNFGLTKTADTTDKWGRPLYKWTNGKTGSALVTYATVKATPVATYQKAVTECDVAHDAGLKVDTAYTLYVNGQKQATTYTVNLTDTVTKMGAQGRLFEVYDDTIVMIDTFLAKVTYVAPAAYDAQGHLRTEATIKLDVYDKANNSDALTLTNGEDAYPYAVGDYVLVNAYTAAVNSATESGVVINDATSTKASPKYGEVVAKATSVDGAQSVIYWNAQQHNVGGTVYDDAYKFLLDNAKTSTSKFTWLFDQYGNLIGNVEIAAATSYGVINSIWWAGNAADGSGVAKANVTYMDGTTAVVDISKMTYLDDTTAPGTKTVKSGDVTHSTGINALVMKADDQNKYFYVDTYINTNTKADENTNDILNGHLFQFTTKDNGTIAAAEVATSVTATGSAKFYSENLFVSKNTQYNGGNLIVDTNTTFLVRSGDGSTKSPYTFKSIVGFANIENYAQGEVDFVDLNGDKVADYVYVIKAPVASKVTSLFYYANGTISYDASTNTYTIPGYVDGVSANIYADGSKNPGTYAQNAFVTALKAQTASGAVYKVALSNNTVDTTVTSTTAIVTLGSEAGTGASVTAYANYPLAACYDKYTVKVDSIVGAANDRYTNGVYTDYVNGTVAGDKFYTVSGNGTDGLTKMPLALGNVTDQNVIVVYNEPADPSVSGSNNRLALQVYAVDKVNTPANPTAGKAEPDTTAAWTYTLNNVYVAPATVYKIGTGGESKDALAAAVANAKELSLGAYGLNVSGLTHTFAAAGLQNASVVVYPSSDAISATVTSSLGTSVNASLKAGNYVVVADAATASTTATQYAVFKIVD